MWHWCLKKVHLQGSVTYKWNINFYWIVWNVNICYWDWLGHTCFVFMRTEIACINNEDNACCTDQSFCSSLVVCRQKKNMEPRNRKFCIFFLLYLRIFIFYRDCTFLKSESLYIELESGFFFERKVKHLFLESWRHFRSADGLIMNCTMIWYLKWQCKWSFCSKKF